MNKYLKLSLTLGLVCLISGGIIAGTYAITKDRINENAVKAEEKGLKNLYPTATDFSHVTEVSNPDYKYVTRYYEVYENELNIGYVFKASGKNAYGKITGLFKITLSGSIGEFYLTENEQTYKDTLEEEYVNKYNNGKRDLEDVTCGATFGATLIKDMAQESQSYYLKEILVA